MGCKCYNSESKNLGVVNTINLDQLITQKVWMSVSPFRNELPYGQPDLPLPATPARAALAGSPKILNNLILKPPPESQKNLDQPDSHSRESDLNSERLCAIANASIFQKYRQKKSCWEPSHLADEKQDQDLRVKLKLNKKGKRDGQNIRTYARYDSVIQALEQELQTHRIVPTNEDRKMLDEFEMKSKRSLERFFFYLLLAKRQNKLENLLPNLKLKIRAKIQQKGGHRTCEFLTSLQSCIEKYIDAAQKLDKAQTLDEAKNAFSIAYLDDLSDNANQKRPPHHNKIKGIDKCLKIYKMIMCKSSQGQNCLKQGLDEHHLQEQKNRRNELKLIRIRNKIKKDRDRERERDIKEKDKDKIMGSDFNNGHGEDIIKIQNLDMVDEKENEKLGIDDLKIQIKNQNEGHSKLEVTKLQTKKSNKKQDQSFSLMEEENPENPNEKKKKLGVKSKKQDDRDIQKYAKFDIVSESSLQFLKLQRLQKNIPEICKKLSQRSLHFFFVILAMIQKQKKDGEFLAHLEASYQRKVQKRYSQRSEYFRERLHQSFFNLIQATRTLFEGRLEQALDMAYEVKSEKKTHPAKASQQKRCKQIYEAIKSSFEGTGQESKLKLQLLIQSDKGHRSQLIKQIKSPTSKGLAQLHLERIKMNQHLSLIPNLLPSLNFINLPKGINLWPTLSHRQPQPEDNTLITECKAEQQNEYQHKMLDIEDPLSRQPTAPGIVIPIPQRLTPSRMGFEQTSDGSS